MSMQLSEHQHGQAPPWDNASVAEASRGAPARLTIDPVCGMNVDPVTSKHRFDHGWKIFHFCLAGCQTKFAADPDRYIKPKAAESAKTGAMYICPMHPQIRQTGPGSCPICGMTLEPVVATVEAAPNLQLADMSRRFWIGLVLTLPVLVLEMGRHIPWLGLPTLVPEQISIWVQFALWTPAFLLVGWPFFQRGAASVRTGHLNMFSRSSRSEWALPASIVRPCATSGRTWWSPSPTTRSASRWLPVCST